MKRVDWKSLRERIPSEVQVTADRKYSILWTKDLKENIGVTDPQKQEIIIELGHSDKETVKVFAHELAHCFSDEYEFSLTESQVLKFENCLYYLLKPGNLFKESK